MILLQAASLFSQATKDDYLKKNKKQKKLATILLAGGGAFILAGVIYPRGDAEHSTSPFYSVVTYPNVGTKAALILTGGVAMLSSIPFYISSGRNKRRAEAISFNLHNQQILFSQEGSLIAKRQPAIRLKVPL